MGMEKCEPRLFSQYSDLGYGLDDFQIVVRIPAVEKIVFLQKKNSKFYLR
jgi:hypothetical protein